MPPWSNEHQTGPSPTRGTQPAKAGGERPANCASHPQGARGPAGSPPSLAVSSHPKYPRTVIKWAGIFSAPAHPELGVPPIIALSLMEDTRSQIAPVASRGERPSSEGKSGAGKGSRTPNLQIRSLALYPVELQLHKGTANKRISAGDFKQNFVPVPAGSSLLVIARSPLGNDKAIHQAGSPRPAPAGLAMTRHHCANRQSSSSIWSIRRPL